eukprot:Plantae.Rhodophyta-Purpureofilum_apyrenoidigerum.ctg16363.p1 GENE.Plantae.Rhodophyta-Purpureofilum_apyrenoidigerum.ctg16363~~Plantae.Rhodophyta-Purpureofilum_apyrenoidigerum.ctg16363.p1  ORF type:complete len:272 (-),score=52.17 Plantae.Rhodophyta-Purpureofilum_apyrenoidigerum.ctg16363:64-879(-)
MAFAGPVLVRTGRRASLLCVARMCADATPPELSVKMGLQSVQARIERAAREGGRNAANAPRLVAVSKTKPTNLLMAAYEAGQRHFGENYAQEMVQKSEEMPEDIKWHFIGPLQSNKAKLLAQMKNLWCVETVDRKKIADALNRAWEEMEQPLQVMLQVNTSGEESKSGVDEVEAPSMAKYIVQNCPKLKLIGVMTIGKLDSSPEPDDFKRLLEVRDAVAIELEVDKASLEVSMGMSADFEAAARMGATNVRVGSTIFGARDYSNRKTEAAT